jgi:hypothetical protein
MPLSLSLARTFLFSLFFPFYASQLMPSRAVEKKKKTTKKKPTTARALPPLHARGNLEEEEEEEEDNNNNKYVPLNLSKQTKDAILLALRTRLKSAKELREFLHNKTNELAIEERALVERLEREKEKERLQRERRGAAAGGSGGGERVVEVVPEEK